MANPLQPNYINGVGRLVTDRFDFQSHVTGTSFRHTADQIDLLAPLNIDGYVATTVQSAIVTLSTIVSPPIIPNATNTTKGIIKLFKDLGGTADSVLVTGLQGIPISTLQPTTGNVLFFNGTVWEPNSGTFAFIPNGDLTRKQYSSKCS